jgi:hypothetical protein
VLRHGRVGFFVGVLTGVPFVVPVVPERVVLLWVVPVFVAPVFVALAPGLAAVPVLTAPDAPADGATFAAGVADGVVDGVADGSALGVASAGIGTTGAGTGP